MDKTRRSILFVIAVALLLVVYKLSVGTALPHSEVAVVLFSALLMLSFATLFLEHFFTTPTDVLSSTVAILLLLAPLHGRLTRLGHWYWIFFAYNLVLAAAALLALLLLDGAETPSARRNKTSLVLKQFAVTFGRARFLFLALFLLALFFYVDSQSGEFIALSVYAAVVLVVDPKRYTLSFGVKKSRERTDVGRIIGVQSKSVYLARAFEKAPTTARFDVVAFRHPTSGDATTLAGVIVDDYVLDEERWIKIFVTDDVRSAVLNQAGDAETPPGVVHVVTLNNPPESLDRLVGTVIEGSTISKVRFEFVGRASVAEGDVLVTSVAGKNILFQVVQGTTAIEALEHRNETALVVGEAVQLGVWDTDRLVFERFGWVPEVNAPLFSAVDPPAFTCAAGEVQVGSIPNTAYPVLLNLREAVTHHTAILGVTGSGKSMFCRELVRRIVGQGMKVICVDFTNEYRAKLQSLRTGDVVAPESQAALFLAIDELSVELDKFANQRNHALIARLEETLRQGFGAAISNFRDSDLAVGLFELPDVSNSTGILDYTRWFFREIFHVARESGGAQNLCIVLEEAHTVIPEWNFLGVEDRRSQAVVNAISQIALQGRKYGVGFIVVAQRTANVSKTVLTQCNSVIAFQQFDKTSGDFLLNYMGSDMVRALPELQFRQAVAVGRAFRSGVPVIFEVPTIVEA